MDKTDAKLIAEYLSGDGSAFKQLVERHLKHVYNFLYRLTGNAQDADDITQEVFLKVWKNLRKYKSDHSFKSWLFRIARNAAYDLLRKKKNMVFSDFENQDGENPLLDNITDLNPLPDELVAQAEKKDFVGSILQQLSPKYREVLLLHYNEHLTFEEIGQVLDKPIDTVKSQHRRALIVLRSIFNKPD